LSKGVDGRPVKTRRWGSSWDRMMMKGLMRRVPVTKARALKRLSWRVTDMTDRRILELQGPGGVVFKGTGRMDVIVPAAR